MSKLYLVMIFTVFIISGCTTSDDESEKTITINIKSEPKQSTKPKAPVVYTMEGHPLGRYSNPEDMTILEYFPYLNEACGKYGSKGDCDRRILSSLRKAERINRNITESDFRNPAWWKFRTDVINKGALKRKSLTPPVGSPISANEAWLAFHNETKQRFFAFRDGKY